jgi:hypothetical protein
MFLAIAGGIFILLALTASLGTTILGWIAVSQIRHSVGKIHGMWLAVFDGLFFPLLMLDALIAVFWIFTLRVVDPYHQMIPINALLALATIVGVDLLIVRWVWRTVNKSVAAPVPPVQKPDRFWRWFAVAVFAMIAIPFLISIVGLLAAIAIPNFVKARARAQSIAQHSAQMLAAQNLSPGQANGRVVQSPPFVARLNQAEVELVAVGDMPWTNPVCWLPNGQLSAGLFPTEGVTMSQWSADMVIKRIAFRIHNETANAVSIPVCRVNQESGVLAESTAWPAPIFLQLIACPTNAVMMNVSLGIANGTWEVATTLEHKNPALSGATSAGEWSASYNSMVGGSGDVAVNCNYNKSEDWETRMICVDDNSKTTVIPENSSRASGLQTGGILLVSPLEFAHIKEFQLQRRKFQWAEFRNVSLQPDHATTVEVKDFGGENQSVQTTPATSPAAQNLSFGPVTEGTLPTGKGGLTPLYDLDHDQPVFDPKPDDTAAGMALLLKPGLAIRHDEQAHKIAFLGISGTVVYLTRSPVGDQWVNLTGMDALTAVRRNATSPGIIQGVECPDNLPQTICFKTGEGKLGILQITGFTENPPGVKIRYKLVQNGQTASTSNYPGDWIWEPNPQILDRVPPIFLLRLSTLPTNATPFDMFGTDGFLARGKTLKELIARVWSQKNSTLKVVFAADLPEDKFDFIVTAQPRWWDLLEAEINQRFHLVDPIENRDGSDVLVVKNASLTEPPK